LKAVVVEKYGKAELKEVPLREVGYERSRLKLHIAV